jgi:hypothetical protein
MEVYLVFEPYVSGFYLKILSVNMCWSTEVPHSVYLPAALTRRGSAVDFMPLFPLLIHHLAFLVQKLNASDGNGHFSILPSVSLLGPPEGFW